MKRSHVLALVAAIAGAAIWIAVARASGRHEAWDSDLYFSAGLPALCLVAAVLALVEPTRPWRWGVWPSVGQFAWLLAADGPGNLLPLGIIVFAIFSIPAILAARLGAWIAAKVSKS